MRTLIHFHIHSTNLKSRPVLPPILPSVLPTPCATPVIADPADDVTLERPCVAFEVVSDADSLTFAAVFDAASVALEVVDACLRVVCRRTT